MTKFDNFTLAAMGKISNHIFQGWLTKINNDEYFRTNNDVQFKNVDVAYYDVELRVMECFENKLNANNWRDAYYKMISLNNEIKQETDKERQRELVQSKLRYQRDMFFWENKEREEQLERGKQTC